MPNSQKVLGITGHPNRLGKQASASQFVKRANGAWVRAGNTGSTKKNTNAKVLGITGHPNRLGKQASSSAYTKKNGKWVRANKTPAEPAYVPRRPTGNLDLEEFRQRENERRRQEEEEAERQQMEANEAKKRTNAAEEIAGQKAAQKARMEAMARKEAADQAEREAAAARKAEEESKAEQERAKEEAREAKERVEQAARNAAAAKKAHNDEETAAAAKEKKEAEAEAAKAAAAAKEAAEEVKRAKEEREAAEKAAKNSEKKHKKALNSWNLVKKSIPAMLNQQQKQNQNQNNAYSNNFHSNASSVSSNNQNNAYSNNFHSNASSVSSNNQNNGYSANLNNESNVQSVSGASINSNNQNNGFNSLSQPNNEFNAAETNEARIQRARNAAHAVGERGGAAYEAESAVREMLGDIPFDGWYTSWVSGKTNYNIKNPAVIHKGTEHQTVGNALASVGKPSASNRWRRNLTQRNASRQTQMTFLPQQTRKLNRWNVEGTPAQANRPPSLPQTTMGAPEMTFLRQEPHKLNRWNVEGTPAQANRPPSLPQMTRTVQPQMAFLPPAQTRGPSRFNL